MNNTEQTTPTALAIQDEQPIDISKEDVQCNKSLDISKFNLISVIHFQDVKHEKRRKFLQYYSNCGSIAHAGQAAGICYNTHFNWVEKVDGYSERFKQAKALYQDRLEHEATRRAVNGIDKGIWYRGRRVGAEKQYSDLLLLAQLKANIPEKYKDRTEVTHTALEAKDSFLSRKQVLAEIAAELNRLQAKELAIDVESKPVDE